MSKFSKTSMIKLSQIHPDLQKVLNIAIENVDFTIVCGYRGQKEQELAYSQGKSKLKYPNSKHNLIPSRAVDIAPYPIDWNDRESFIRLVSYIQGIGDTLGIKIRLGVDWNNNFRTKDEKFSDAPHIELV